jgi:hypothetical protein
MAKDHPTVAISTAKGNALFEKAVVAVGLDEGTTRWLLVAALNALGAKADELTPDDLGHVLPEIDRRLRQLVQDDQADAAVKRLYRLLFDHAGHAEPE